MEATQDIIDFGKRYSRVLQSAIDEVEYYWIYFKSWVRFVVNFILDFRASVSAYSGYKVDEIKALFADMEPPGEATVVYRNLLRNYFWVAICLAMGTLAVMTPLVSLFSPIAEYLLTPAAMFVTALFVLPYCMMNVFPYTYASEGDRRVYLMFATMVDYMLFSIWMGKRQLTFYAPPTVLHAALTGLVGYILLPFLGALHRVFSLILLVCLPALVDYGYGHLMNGKEKFTASYVVWMSAISFIGILDAQIKISAFRVGSVHSLHQAISVVFYSLINTGMFYLYSSSQA